MGKLSFLEFIWQELVKDIEFGTLAPSNPVQLCQIVPLVVEFASELVT